MSEPSETATQLITRFLPERAKDNPPVSQSHRTIRPMIGHAFENQKRPNKGSLAQDQ